MGMARDKRVLRHDDDCGAFVAEDASGIPVQTTARGELRVLSTKRYIFYVSAALFINDSSFSTSTHRVPTLKPSSGERWEMCIRW